MALIVLREPVSAEELAGFCRTRLADFKVPTWYKFVESVPKTATGRVKKALLKKDPDLLKGAVNIVPAARKGEACATYTS
jgi:acyl-CoA synthetase (AMP-forming)/AMP-acid ligase II